MQTSLYIDLLTAAWKLGLARSPKNFVLEFCVAGLVRRWGRGAGKQALEGPWGSPGALPIGLTWLGRASITVASSGGVAATA